MAKDGGLAPTNARLETAATSGMFRSAFAGARALAPMIGCYEWEALANGKQPHFIHAGDELLAAAGLYAPRKDPRARRLRRVVPPRQAGRAESDGGHDRRELPGDRNDHDDAPSQPGR